MQTRVLKTPNPKAKDKKLSTRVCTIESVEQRDTSARQNHSSKKKNISRNIYRNPPSFLDTHQSSKTKNQSNRDPKHHKKKKKKKSNPCQELTNHLIHQQITSDNRSDTLSVNNSQLLSVSKARDNGCDLKQKISISLTTNNLINKVFNARKNRMLVSMENSDIPRSGPGDQVKEQTSMQAFGYSSVINRALRKISNIPHLSINPINHQERPAPSFLDEAKLYIQQSKRKWSIIHKKLHEFIEQQQNYDMKGQTLDNLIRLKKFKKVHEGLKKQGQQNYRWFQFMENLTQNQVDLVYSNLHPSAHQSNKQSQVNSSTKSESETVKEKVEQQEKNGQQQKPETQEVSTIKEKLGDSIKEKLDDDRIEKIGEGNFKEEERIDQSIGQYFLSNYNGQTWRGDLSSDEEDILNNSQNSSKEPNNGEEIYERSSDSQFIQRMSSYQQIEEQNESLEERTDIVMNWIIDEFVIQLASHLNLDLVMGLDDTYTEASHCQPKNQTKQLNNRIEQMYKDCQQIDTIDDNCNRSATTNVIIDALDETYRKVYNRKNGYFQGCEGQKMQAKKQLKRIIITRKDHENLEPQNKREEDIVQFLIKNTVSDYIFSDIVRRESVELMKTMKKIENSFQFQG